VLTLGLALAAAEEEAAEAVYTPPETVEGAQFYEPFLDTWAERWVVSKDAEFTGTWKHETYVPDGLPGDKGLVVGDPAKRHAVSTTFPALDPKGTGLVVQYELQLKNGLECGGAYLKLLTATEELSLEGFKADTPYTIMFGPDKCGETNKVHFILRHKSPKTGEWEEKHLVTPPVPNVSDKQTHLYTAIIGTDNVVKILVDNEEKKRADLLSPTDFKPPVNPPKEIDDPADSKPTDWIDDPKMDDPEASKPEDWDEDAPSQIVDPKVSKPDGWADDAPLKVPDPAAKAPDDWDEDEDGEWEAPLIDNPECKVGCGEWTPPKIPNPDFKGKWFAPKIDNPSYIGVWKPAQIPNPNFFLDEQPHAMTPIGGIGIELWTMQNGILFDNILVSTTPEVASELAAGTFVKRQEAEKAKKKSSDRSVEREEGFMGSVKFYATKVGYFIQDNLLYIGLTICLGLIPLLLYCCWPSSADPVYEPDEPPDEPEPPVDEEPEPEDDDQPIKDITEEEKPKPAAKASARKRTAKAS